MSMFIEKKCEMIFHVGIDSNEEANKFLRKLWSELRREFGKCAWNYIPHKIGQDNTIIFGTMDIEIPEGSLIVSICYLKKGTIKTISFGFMDQKPSEHRLHELNQNIQEIINISKSNLNQPAKFLFKTGINSIFKSLGYYKGEAFSTYFNQLNESQKVFLRGCQHFHTARKYDAQIYDRFKYHSTEEIESDLYQINFEERDEQLSIAAKMGSTHMEIASVLYISALEVASSINIANPKNCSECGQPIYNIGRRVVDIGEKYLNVALGKEFKEYYRKRSKYLHSEQTN